MKTRSASFLLGFALLVAVSWCPSALAQGAAQEPVARKVKVKVDARYPDLARQMHLAGKVKVEVVVSPDGRVRDTRLIGGNPILASAALDAVRQWRYEPAPGQTVGIVEVDFRDSRK